MGLRGQTRGCEGTDTGAVRKLMWGCSEEALMGDEGSLPGALLPPAPVAQGQGALRRNVAQDGQPPPRPALRQPPNSPPNPQSPRGRAPGAAQDHPAGGLPAPIGEATPGPAGWAREPGGSWPAPHVAWRQRGVRASPNYRHRSRSGSRRRARLQGQTTRQETSA